MDIVAGYAALTVLDSMGEHTEIVISGLRSANGGNAESFRMTTDTSQFAELAAKFKACIAAHADSNAG